MVSFLPPLCSWQACFSIVPLLIDDVQTHGLRHSVYVIMLKTRLPLLVLCCCAQPRVLAAWLHGHMLFVGLPVVDLGKQLRPR
jgi:hypothetical protein